MLAAAIDHTDRREGTTLGFAFVLMDGIGALGAVVAGVAAGFSWSYMFGIVACLSLVAGAIALFTVFGGSNNKPTKQRTGILKNWLKRGYRRGVQKDIPVEYSHLNKDVETKIDEAKSEITKRFWHG